MVKRHQTELFTSFRAIAWGFNIGSSIRPPLPDSLFVLHKSNRMLKNLRQEDADLTNVFLDQMEYEGRIAWHGLDTPKAGVINALVRSKGYILVEGYILVDIPSSRPKIRRILGTYEASYMTRVGKREVKGTTLLHALSYLTVPYSTTVECVTFRSEGGDFRNGLHTMHQFSRVPDNTQRADNWSGFHSVRGAWDNTTRTSYDFEFQLTEASTARFHAYVRELQKGGESRVSSFLEEYPEWKKRTVGEVAKSLDEDQKVVKTVFEKKGLPLLTNLDLQQGFSFAGYTRPIESKGESSTA